jgi:hypothetical protein
MRNDHHVEPSKEPMDTDLTECYNDGLIASPHLEADAKRLRPPGWRPTTAQVQLARAEAKKCLLLLAVIIGLLGLIAEWLAG